MKIIFLGTAAMQPTRKRNLPSIFINYKAEKILIDCGEGTQRQMKIAKIKPTKLTKILISHWHGDHVIGLGGLIRNLGANEYNKTLEIYAPRGIKDFVTNILHSCIFKEKIKLKLIEIKEGIIFENKDFKIEAVKLEHSNLCFGFNLIEKDKRKINLKYLKKYGLIMHPLLGELQKGRDIVWKGKNIKVKDATILIKGKKISFNLDTKYCPASIKLAKNADVLVSESTYLEDFKDKASLYCHLTAKQAGEIAKKANAKKLILTHFSQRYKDANEFKREAAKVYKNSIVCAEDFMELDL